MSLTWNLIMSSTPCDFLVIYGEALIVKTETFISRLFFFFFFRHIEIEGLFNRTLKCL